jgi:hypothetical protein
VDPRKNSSVAGPLIATIRWLLRYGVEPFDDDDNGLPDQRGSDASACLAAISTSSGCQGLAM